jgi:hypothetical protein
MTVRNTHTLVLGAAPGFAAITRGLSDSVLATLPLIPTIYHDDQTDDVWTFSIGTKTWSKLQRGTDTTHPSTTIFVDKNRTDSYTPDGTIGKPFQSIADAFATITKASAIVLAPGSYSEVGGAFPDFPLVIHGNGSTVTFSGAVSVSRDYTAHDLNAVCGAGVTYAGVAGTERFILRNGTRRGPLTISKGLLDLQSCTQLWSSTSDKLQVTGSGLLVEIGCVNTLPVEQSGAASVVYIENCNWNTNRANTYLLKSTAGQFSVANSVVVNGAATTGGGIDIENAATKDAPNAVSGVVVSAALAVTVASGVTLWSKVAANGAAAIGSSIVGVPDVKMYTTEPFIPVSAGLTLSAASPDNLLVTANVPLNLGTAMIAKMLRVASTSPYTIVVPTGVAMYYNGTPYTGVTKTVPAGFRITLEQVTAAVWMATGTATLS